MLASKELRKKTAVLRMDTLSPPSTSTPMAIRASMHLRRRRAFRRDSSVSKAPRNPSGS